MNVLIRRNFTTLCKTFQSKHFERSLLHTAPIFAHGPQFSDSRVFNFNIRPKNTFHIEMLSLMYCIAYGNDKTVTRVTE